MVSATQRPQPSTELNPDAIQLTTEALKAHAAQQLAEVALKAAAREHKMKCEADQEHRKMMKEAALEAQAQKE